MTPQELKASILQLAIQGKLVEQRPEEGTGAELLRDILTQRSRVAECAEKKLTRRRGERGGQATPSSHVSCPMSTLPSKTISANSASPREEIPDSEKPFDIPESWVWVRLRDVCSKIVDGDHNPPSGISEKTKFLMLSAKNICDDSIVDLDDVRFLTKDVFLRENERTRVHPGDLFLTIVGTLGRSCVYKGGYNICFQRSVAVITTLIYNYYLKYVLDSSSVQQFMVANATGTAQKGFYLNQVERLLIPLPPLAEQKRIVAKIEELLPYIDRYEKAWSKLEDFNKRFPGDMQKSLLQMAIQGKLVDQRPEEGTGEELYRRLKPYHRGLKPCKDELNYASMDFDIPENWKMIELNQLFDFVDYRGKTPTKTKEGVFLVTASNIKQAYMDYTRKEYISRKEYEGRQSRGLTEKGDLLFTTEAPMGNAALCDLDECSCGQRIITFKEYIDCTALPALYMYFVLSPQFQQQLLDNCTGTTAKGIKADKLKHFLIPLPPYAEQKRIVAKLEELLPLCERLK